MPLLQLLVGALFGVALSFQLEGLLYGILWMTLPSLASDLLTFRLAQDESILRLRRVVALTLFADFLWLCSASVGRLGVQLGVERVVAISYAIGFSGAAAARFTILRAVSSMTLPRTIMLSLLHPGLCLAATFSSYPLGLQTLVYIAAALPFTMGSASLFLSRVDSVAKPVLGHGSSELFRAFLADWMENQGGPLEGIFDHLAVSDDARFGLVSFYHGDEESAVMVVPYVHAGPFRNVGSSLLTSLLQERLRGSTNSAVAVFHGTSGHERNVATHVETERIVNALTGGPGLRREELKATSMVRFVEGRAKVACQRLNNIGLLIVTLAPSRMEDLSGEVGFAIAAYGKTLGFDAVFVVDAHNSAGKSEALLSDEDIGPVIAASKKALEAVRELPLLPASVGACSLMPEGFTVEQGMGRGGVAAVVVGIPGQTATYVTIDGNNMVSGLRERMLDRLGEIGVDVGEICTSDTHEVNATITGRGYHPVGEAMDNDAVVKVVEQVVLGALETRKPAWMVWKEITVEKVRFLGSKNVDLFTAVTDAAIAEAKRAGAVLLPLGLAAALALILLLPV